jgi:DNA polymerase-1
MANHEGQPKRLAELIKELRSLEKWYSTYILPTIKNAQYDGNVYTQINSSGAVSGRMSSNFQQFPKNPLKTLDGQELFHPRKAFTVKGGHYESIVYIDYDQIELVTQAHYTLLVSGGDINLCRAYMPFRCFHYLEKMIYDYRILANEQDGMNSNQMENQRG